MQDSNKASLLGNPVLAQANSMLNSLKNLDEKDPKTESSLPRPESRSSGPKGEASNALKDFNSLLSAVGHKEGESVRYLENQSI